MTTKFSRQYNLQFQNFIVMAFPKKNSIFGQFSSLPPRPTPLKSANFIYPRARIPQKCCGDCWGDYRGKSECRGECCGAVPGDLPRDFRGECRATALLCSSQEKAVSRHSPWQSLGRSPGTAPQHSPRHSDFPRQSPQSPQHFWGIRARGFLWLASPISILVTIGAF